jgi:hydrogenase maturation protease
VSAATPTVVVLGVGNLILSDEGVGVRCVQALEAEGALPAHVGLLDGGTSTHALLEAVEDLEHLIIVDAVAGDHPPGAVVIYRDAEIPAALSNRLSPHQHGINDLLAELALLGRSPKQVTLLGVQPERLTLGMELSPAVAAALPRLCAEVRAAVGP